MRLVASCISLFVFSSLIAAPVVAQETATTAPAAAVNTLPDLWRKEQASRLLLFVPPHEADEENIFRRVRQREEEKAVVAPPNPRSVTEWLQANDAMLRSFGNISVAGKRTAIHPATKLGLPDYFDTGNGQANRTNALRELVATLSPVQWKQIASSQGLAYGSLSGEQPALWEMAVPNPFVIDRVPTAYVKRDVAPENTHTLTDAERRQIRLRVKLTGTVDADYESGRGSYPVVFRKNREEKGRKGSLFLALREAESYGTPQEKRDDGLFAYGQYIAQYQPNRSKTLPASVVANLSVVPVAVPTQGAAPTAGTVLDAISSAIGTKLYAGAKFRAQPVTVVGSGTVATSSLLGALLFATDSTVRVLPPSHTGDQELYVVAPETEPVGRTVGYITDWYNNARAKGWDTDQPDRMRANDPAYLLRFDADDPAAVSDTVRERYIKTIAQKLADGEPADDVSFKITMSDLPASTQQEINETAKQHVKMSELTRTNYRLRLDTLTWSCAADFSYLVSGTGDFAGEVGSDFVGGISYLLSQTDTSKVSLQGRVVALSASTVEEARELLQAARAAGATEVWLQASPPVVTGAVSAAGTMPVRGVVSLLGVREDTPPALPRDENLYGKKSREWLVPDDPAVIDDATERARAMAAVPGIAGIVLRDTVPPGYRGGSDTSGAVGEPSTQFLAGSAIGLGYSLAHRRAYLQETGQDPADIIETLPIDLPYQEDSAAMHTWQTWRRDKIRPLWKALQTATEGKPVLLEGEASFRELGQRGRVHIGVFVPWDTKQAEPPLTDGFTNAVSTELALPKMPGAIVSVAGNPGVRSSPSQLIHQIHREDKPGETLWDLSDIRVPGTAERLRALRRTP